MNRHFQLLSRSEDSNLFRSRIVHEFDPKLTRTSSRLNWNRVLGFTLAMGIGAGFWTAAGALIARLYH
ncbi:MAG: hypothetical protein WAK56_04125 [Candidatus Sulfotelmatobacter sp.]